MVSSSSFEIGDNALNQVGPGWIVGSLPQVPTDNPTAGSPINPFPPSVGALPPPYSETALSTTPIMDSDTRASDDAPPPSYEEAVKWKS